MKEKRRVHDEVIGQYIDDKGRTVTRKLCLVTRKNAERKCLESSVRVDSVDPEDPRWLTHAVYQDYHKVLARNSDRATEKNLDALHQSSMAELPTIRALIRAHYKDWVREEA